MCEMEYNGSATAEIARDADVGVYSQSLRNCSLQPMSIKFTHAQLMHYCLPLCIVCINPYPAAFQVELEKRLLGVGGYALVSWCPEH